VPSSKSKQQHHPAWIFGGLTFLVLVGFLIWGPKELPAYKFRLLQLFSAALVGFLGFFFTGEVMLNLKWKLSKGWKMRIQAGGGMALFVLVFLFWQSSFSPVRAMEEIRKIEGRTERIEGNTEKIVQLLEAGLRINEEDIAFSQGQLGNSSPPMPSERTLELAKQIPDDANSFAMALKAVAERDFEKAKRFFDAAQKETDADQTRIYAARGDMEIYAGRYKEAADWFDKLLALSPDNSDQYPHASMVYFFSGQYQKAEPLMRRILEESEKSLGPNHPRVAACLTNLALLLQCTERSSEAEKLLRRALVIEEKSYGRDGLKVAFTLGNLALLVWQTNGAAEAEPLMQRALDIEKKFYGPDHIVSQLARENLAKMREQMGDK
jgi:tetratricopeptide (TPR) repeat protein